MKFVFLDRDGVINENRTDHVKSWDEFVFLPGALEALRVLHETGWRVVVITNQAIVNREIITRSALDEMHSRMTRIVELHGGAIEAVLACPHRPDENCECRKPRPGLLLQAAARYRLPLDQCYLVGDALTDVMAGNTVGARCLLVLTGRGAHQFRDNRQACGPYGVAPDLKAAVQRLVRLEHERTHQPLPQIREVSLAYS